MTKIPISDRLAILSCHEGWFGRAPKEFQEAVLSRCRWRVCPAGETIYAATDETALCCGVVDGSVDVYSRFGAGDNPLLHIVHEGVWLGYGTVVAWGEPRLTAVARVDTLLACLPENVLKGLLGARPEWWRIIAAGILEYGDMAIAAYADSLIADNDRRCASTLLRIAGHKYPRRARPERSEVLISQGELASMVKLSRTSLVQVLQRFARLGLVEQGYRMIRVVDVAGLTAMESEGLPSGTS
ncbi:MAG: helix-turn-helix domain-containing protein [Thiobacillus sp.]|nr:helix-turn-helix domain-containing protein [Thiobacillus sp.]